MFLLHSYKALALHVVHTFVVAAAVLWFVATAFVVPPHASPATLYIWGAAWAVLYVGRQIGPLDCWVASMLALLLYANDILVVPSPVAYIAWVLPFYYRWATDVRRPSAV